MYGNLYLVSTPIGNLDDLTIRAKNVLTEVDVIFAESVERTKKLLSHYSIETKVLSYNKDNEKRKISSVLKYLNESKNIALVTDAGTPAISDPGFYLLSQINESTKVIPVPGVSSLTCALSVSKIPINSFIFLGFLPKKGSERKKKLAEASDAKLTICLFESKHRLIELLKDISTIYGESTKVGIFRELTKIYETVTHKSVSQHIMDFEKNQPKGEFVIIVSPKQRVSLDNNYQRVIEELIIKNFSNKDIVDLIKLISTDSKKEIYKNVLSIRQDT